MNTIASNLTATPLTTNLSTPGTRTTADALRSIPAALRSEMIKVTTVRSNLAILGVSAAISGLASWALASFTTGEVFAIAEVFTAATIFTAVFASVAGILMFTSEAQHGTLAPMLAAQPSKALVAGAKVTTAAAFGAVLSVATMAAAIGGGLASGIDMGDTSRMLSEAGRATLFTGLASVLGLGIGMVARHSAAAITGLLVWWLVAETLLSGLMSESASRFLPFAAGNALVGVSNGSSMDESLMLTATEGALVFGGYALLAVALGWAMLNKAEAN